MPNDIAPSPAAQKVASQVGKVAPREKTTRNDTKRKAAPKTAAKASSKKAPPPRKARFGADAKITLVAKENPKREGTASFKAFAKYKSGQTVAEALKAGVRRADLSYDSAAGYITIK